MPLHLIFHSRLCLFIHCGIVGPHTITDFPSTQKNPIESSMPFMSLEQQNPCIECRLNLASILKSIKVKQFAEQRNPLCQPAFPLPASMHSTYLSEKFKATGKSELTTRYPKTKQCSMKVRSLPSHLAWWWPSPSYGQKAG